MSKTWAYGVTTVPERIDDLLPRTLKSLAEAGFAAPRIFIDGECTPDVYANYKANFDYDLVFRGEKVRTFGNWVLGMWELFIRYPLCERYAIFQDDMVTYKNLRSYLDHCKYPQNGYWNLYSFPKNEALAESPGCGWHLSNQLGKGAVGLVFDRDGLTTLLSSLHMVLRPLDAKRGWKSVDGGIVTAMKKAGCSEYVHNPGLIQHTGAISAMGNRKHQLSTTFMGEDYDALQLC